MLARNTYPHLRYIHSYKVAPSLSLSHSLPLSRSHSLALALALPLSLSLTHSRSLSAQVAEDGTRGQKTAQVVKKLMDQVCETLNSKNLNPSTLNPEP